MIDQSHNVTDPIESLMVSGDGDRARLRPGAARRPRRAATATRRTNDALMASETLKARLPHRRRADPGDGAARARAAAIDPVAAYRALGLSGEGGGGAAGQSPRAAGGSCDRLRADPRTLRTAGGGDLPRRQLARAAAEGGGRGGAPDDDRGVGAGADPRWNSAAGSAQPRVLGDRIGRLIGAPAGQRSSSATRCRSRSSRRSPRRWRCGPGGG